jgi:hypothetical protein
MPRLRFVRNAPDLWYKDIGGKRQCMELEVELVGKLPNGKKLTLATDLFYESGERVLDTWQTILTSLNSPYEPVTLQNSKPRCVLMMRIEKVSTNFQGQRFKIRVRPDDSGGAQTYGVKPIFTTAIESKAKPKRVRKRPSGGPSAGGRRASKRVRVSSARNGDGEREGAMEAAMDGLAAHLQRTEESLRDCVSVLARLTDRLAAVEERLSFHGDPGLGSAMLGAHALDASLLSGAGVPAAPHGAHSHGGGGSAGSGGSRGYGDSPPAGTPTLPSQIPPTPSPMLHPQASGTPALYRTTTGSVIQLTPQQEQILMQHRLRPGPSRVHARDVPARDVTFPASSHPQSGPPPGGPAPQGPAPPAGSSGSKGSTAPVGTAAPPASASGTANAARRPPASAAEIPPPPPVRDNGGLRPHKGFVNSLIGDDDLSNFLGNGSMLDSSSDQSNASPSPAASPRGRIGTVRRT